MSRPCVKKLCKTLAKTSPMPTNGIVLAELESQPLPKSNYCPTKMALLVGQANRANQASRANQA